MPEAWLRGPVSGVDPMLQPAAHALTQAREDIDRVGLNLTEIQLWARQGGAASVGFHLRHIAGSLDRLLTYARGAPLSERQLAYLKTEGDPGSPPARAASVTYDTRQAIDAALEQLRTTPPESLLEPRTVGRAALPSTVLGLLFHAAEHTTRHVGQAITTVKIVTGLRDAAR